MQRNTYIENNDDTQALFEYLDKLGTLECTYEEVSVLDSIGRVTYEAVFAKNCDPMYNAAAMDGIAVEAHDTFLASDKNPLKLTLDKDFYYINTGGEVKGRYNAVIMIEDVFVLNEKKFP
jgi:putative molybdopterin biosynthesis protein